jgi:cytochrome c biogenesis protein CcdA
MLIGFMVAALVFSIVVGIFAVCSALEAQTDSHATFSVMMAIFAAGMVLALAIGLRRVQEPACDLRLSVPTAEAVK